MIFEDFVAREMPPLLRFATVLANDRGLAEDVCQEVLIKVRDRWDRIEPLEHRQAYVRRMIVNEYLSWRRKWARLIPKAEITVRDSQPDHAEAIAEHESVLAMVGGLPDRQRTALVLRYFQDLTHAEVAHVMGCRETTVRGYIHRALSTLRIENDRDSAAVHPGSLRTEGLS